MDNNTVLVLANPTEPQLKMLEELPPETGIAVGITPEAFERTAANANVIFNWSGSGALLREVFAIDEPVPVVRRHSAVPAIEFEDGAVGSAVEDHRERLAQPI